MKEGLLLKFKYFKPETKVELPEKEELFGALENNVNGPSINCVTDH